MNKKKSTKRIWSAWGDWIWSTTHRRYYSQRQDQTGITSGTRLMEIAQNTGVN